MMSSLLPQIAYAAPSSSSDGGGDKGIVGTVKSWFSDDDDSDNKPPTGDKLEIPSRQKLPKSKNSPKATRVKELTGKRTSQARFWQMSDGSVEADLTAVPTNYRSGTSWLPIDTTVRSSQAKGFDFANTANEGKSWFGSDAGRLLRFQSPDGRSVTMGLDADKASLKPTVKGDTVTYSDAVSGADLEYKVGRGQVKENIVLDQAPAGPVSYTFTLNTDGLTPKARKDGSVALFGELPNTPVMVIPAPYMTDAKKDALSPTGGTYSTKVTQKLTRVGKQWKLVVTPDTAWLAAKDRQYPVAIDPTITIAPNAATSQDTMVLSDQAGVNFNNTWKLSAGKTDTGIARSLIKFPLSEIPSGTKIDYARLGMYFDQAHTTNANDVTIGAYRATGAWDESTATWTNTNALVGELSGTTVTQDDGDAGTAAVGSWPGGTTTGGAATNDDFVYNKTTSTGQSYTWQPNVAETASYRVDVHYPAASDAATAAPYTVTYRDGTKNYTVNQTGTAGTWKTLDATQYYFAKGNTGKIVLGGTGSATTRTLADSIRLVNPASIVKNTGEYNQWHDFAVTDTVQKWVSGTATNYGFILKGTDESGTALTGGPRYEAGDGSVYGGETSSIPRLTVTYGKVGTSLKSPTVVHSTGPELSWSKYTNTTGDTGLDIAEYQLHRSTQQVFTPSAATLIAPIASGATTYTDTTAVPTPDSSSAEIGKSYYYQLAVKTKDGQLLGSPTRVVGIPKAGRTMKIIQGSQGGVTDTTLSSQQPTTNQDAIQSFGVGQKWLSVGNNSTTYGKTRAVLKFPTTGIPTTATVLENKMYMWGAETTTGTDGAIYELHGLTKDFDETTATWNNLNATTAWTTAGGDMSATVSDTVASVSEVGRHWWDATGLMQSWVKTPTGNHGVAVKLKDETTTGPQERTLFLNGEAAEPQLRPYMQVIYVDAATEDTYYAPQTPARMTPNSTYTVDFTVTNTTAAAWAAGERELSYTWKLPDGTDVTTGGNQLKTAIPALLPGKSATIKAKVQTPINSDNGSKRTDHVLGWDVRKISDGSWLSAGTGGIPTLKQNVAVEDPTSNDLGLERFYSYTGKNTGAGSAFMSNLSSGNAVWSYNAFTNPGRGLNTFAGFSYNSLDTSDTVLGAGWSGQAAGPIRMGAPLDFRPNPNPTEIKLPDGDGTTHIFAKQGDGSWKAPAGAHFKLAPKAGLDCTPLKDPVPDAWTMTSPDGTRFLFGCDGYLTSEIDKNGNTQSFTYEERKSNNKPTKFLTYITDPAGRQSLTVDYFKKGDASYDYIDATGAKVTGTNLTNSKIYDHVKSMTDISGRKVSFSYTDKGLLGQITDGDGSAQPKVFKFTYDATQGNKNVKLVKVTDPRGNATQLAYYAPQTGDDPKYHWWTKTITDRLNGATGFTYAANATNTKFTDTKVTDAEAHTTTTTSDDFGRPVQATNAKSQTAKTSWDADNNVTYIEEANGAKTAYCYDQKTGYPLWQRDAENNKAGVPPSSDCAPGTYPANSQRFEYQTRLDGYSADLYTKTSPEGRKWQFGYDSFGNLKTVTDPKGVESSTADDYTTKYDYDAYGQQTKATDANGNATQTSDFAPVGSPKTVTDPYAKATKFVYDERGQVTSATDALIKTSTQTYDTYGRPLVSKVPKDQAAGIYITTPAPVYDANDNIVESTSPTNAVSKAVYDPMDQVMSATAPANNLTTERKTAYTYDKVGNLRTTTEPKGVATTADATDYVTTNNYDAIYQLTSAVNAKDDKVSYEYDNVGNAVTVIDPKKNASADTTDYSSKTEYDLDHRPVKQIDAAGKYTTTSYDKDSLVVATTDEERNKSEVVYDARAMVAEQKVPYDGTTVRTTRFHYDQVGNTIKVETPRGTATTGTDADFAARTEYDKLDRPVKQFQPYDPADEKYNKADVYTETVYDEVGRVKKTSLPPAGDPARIDTDYTYFDNGWIKTSTDAWNTKTAYDYNNVGQQEKRTLTGDNGTSTRAMGWSHYPDGSLKGRTDAAGDPSADRSYAYDYDLNGNMLTIGETVGSTTSEPYTMTYTGLNQVDKVAESLTGQEPKTTSYTYDADGQLDTVSHPQQNSKYEYDLRNLLKKVTASQVPTDPQPDITQFTYTDRGQRATLTKGNGNTVDYTYYANSAPKTSTEKTSQGALVSSHGYEYDANGNKSKDTASLLSGDGDGVRQSVTNYTYDPVDRIRELDKTGSKPRTEQYWHDDNSNVVKQLFLQKSEVTEFYYNKNRLSSSSNLVDSSAIYNYDTFGRMKSVTENGGAAVEENTFDGFDRLIGTVRKAGDKTNTTNYRYDALDRTVEKSVNNAYTDEYSYLGLDSEVFSDELDGTLVKTYQFGLGGERLSQLNHLNGESGYYGYNSHGDVETFTNASDGKPSSTYGYTAYGQDAKDEWTGLDSIVAPGDEGENPYRFNGKRWNAQSETYDMGFRDYSPEHNRFINRDSYTGAAADMSLGAGPATSNRYGFAGGNPVNSIERDGHEACDVGCQARNQYQMGGDPIIPDPERLEFNVQYHDGSTGLENWVDPWDFVKELSGFSDIQGCSNDPSAWQCTIAAASVFPGVGKGAKLLDDAVDAGRGLSRAPRFTVDSAGTAVDNFADDLGQSLERLGSQRQAIINAAPKRQRPGTITDSTIPGAQFGRSGFTDPIHPKLQDLYAKLNVTNGRCSEMHCINQAFNANIDPAGHQLTTIGILSKRIGTKLDGELMLPCAQCTRVLNDLGVNYTGRADRPLL
ncbi:DNRLRE domain-containing protein [Streptomyces sp. NBC_01669]|uniref:DNRLRE domain-containing protein n=1 Tax=Streptomyces sp. NBC_01669 TaxID=2975909 RepID=UPI00225B8E55|nr:DNRLRE domain-containing protein [Streptomyces sp. NBC_01669]MCX4536876.1 DNRLRE domain-containing protein [Streptomyces sp. NBC_01669]